MRLLNWNFRKLKSEFARALLCHTIVLHTPAPYPTVKITRKGAARVASGHPWVFRSDVADTGTAAAGDAVIVADPSNRTLGSALYSSTSQIALRMVSAKAESIDQAFLTTRIGAALEHRRRVVSGSNAYRAVFSEADRLPGLTMDVYGDAVVLQTLTQGMDRLTPDIVAAVQELLHPRVIVARNDVPVRAKEGLAQQASVLHGDAGGPVEINMNGLGMSVDLLGGQKTGIFLDQRENYAAAARWARGRALDCFTCTGGFALHMAARCESVEAVDSSAAALATAGANAARNHLTNIVFREADAFDLLAGYAAAGRRFDTIVLDPPAFAKSRANVEGALRGYKEINLRGLQLLEPGGILITCSCSHHISEADLLQTVAEASLDARRTLRVIERRAQSLDHPILLTVPETLYLKCLIFEVTA